MLVLVAFVVFYARLLVPAWWLLGLVGGGGPATLRSALARLPFLAALAIVAVARPRPRILLAGDFAVVAVSVVIALRSVASVGMVIYRSAGSDYLTYESHARTILDTWSLYFAAGWMGARLRARRTTVLGVAGIALAGLLVLTLTTSTYVASPVLAPLSEPPTWTPLLALFPLLFAPGRPEPGWWARRFVGSRPGFARTRPPHSPSSSASFW